MAKMGMDLSKSMIGTKIITDFIKKEESTKIFEKEPLNDIFTKYETKEKYTIKEKPPIKENEFLSFFKELNTFFEKRFKITPVAAPPAHVPANSTAFTEQASDSVEAFLQSHGVKTPAAGIAEYEPPKPATRAGI